MTSLGQGILTDGDRTGTVDLLVLTCLVQLLLILKYMFLSYKTNYLNEEINRTEPSILAVTTAFGLKASEPKLWRQEMRSGCHLKMEKIGRNRDHLHKMSIFRTLRLDLTFAKVVGILAF
jgi:hypothetical protein